MFVHTTQHTHTHTYIIYKWVYGGNIYSKFPSWKLEICKEACVRVDWFIQNMLFAAYMRPVSVMSVMRSGVNIIYIHILARICNIRRYKV